MAYTWNGSQYAILNNQMMTTSPDGANWTATRITGTGTASFSSLVWAGDRYVAIGASVIFQSADGIAWTQVASRLNAFTAMDIIWTGELIVAVTADGKAVISPDKGANWLRRDLGTGALRAVAWNGSRLAAVGENGTIVTSD